ncbi:SUMF1/EgtB/PvdO family nonheme iron enzyme [bacterium]|nr:SUMF1/EgtB/PvdO family nonheme iron enzyme [bacterium]
MRLFTKLTSTLFSTSTSTSTLFLTLTLTLTLFLTFTSTLSAQEAFIAQDFEESVGDEWSYTAQPEELQRVILWGRMNQPVGNTIAQSGDWYWATWDLDNMEHSLVFDSVELPFGDVYTLHFWYYSANIDTQTDYVKYCLEYDDGTEWNNWQDLESNLTGWNQVSLDIPLTESQVRLKVSAQYDGFAKYVHFDNFVINNEPAPLTAPIISNITAEQANDGSKLVDIYYDLFDANNDPCDIELLISDDNGVSYSFTPDSANLSGHIGSDITPGNNKHIIWDAGNESQDFSAENYYFKIRAEDNTFLQIVTPVISPESETYDEAQTITITCETEDAEIYYTLDGSDPDQTDNLYTEAFELDETTTVKARAYKEDWQESEIATADYVINSDFVLVEGGTYNNETADVTISDFYMSKYEITHTKFIGFLNSYGVASNGSYNGVELIDMDDSDCAIGYSNGNFYFDGSSYATNAECPVIEVTWYGSAVYSNWLSSQEGLTPCYNTSTWTCNINANGYRLPTEMEWMYAAKGGNQEPATGYNQYAGTDVEAELTNYAWYSPNSGSTTHVVGTKLPNQLGLYDMSGNVWEWCNDWYGSYSSSAQTDPVGPATGSYRVRRGGGWSYDADRCRVALRGGSNPSYSNSDLGFRVTRAAE